MVGRSKPAQLRTTELHKAADVSLDSSPMGTALMARKAQRGTGTHYPRGRLRWRALTAGLARMGDQLSSPAMRREFGPEGEQQQPSWSSPAAQKSRPAASRQTDAKVGRAAAASEAASAAFARIGSALDVRCRSAILCIDRLRPPRRGPVCAAKVILV